MYVYIHHVHVYVYASAFVYVYAYACVHVYVHIYVYAYVINSKRSWNVVREQVFWQNRNADCKRLSCSKHTSPIASLVFSVPKAVPKA